MKMLKQQPTSSLAFFLILSISICIKAAAASNADDASRVGTLVRKDQRQVIAETEFGRISAVEINDGTTGRYHLQFITLDPNSLFLPVLLHADMVFYVQTGSGSLSWTDDEGTNQIDVKQGDISRLESGSVFFVKSSLETEREKLRICAIFSNAISFEYSHQMYFKPYSTVTDLVTGFDNNILQATFQVSGEVIDDIMRPSKPPPIIHAPLTNKTDDSEWTNPILSILTRGDADELNSKKKKKTKTFNILETKPDFQNCNGWSTAVKKKDLKALKGSNLGVFMMYLAQGSMTGPHWNPMATQISIVTHGQGMVRVVCSSMANMSECKNTRFKVQEGDVFAIPSFHPMAHMAYNNETFAFIGFSTTAKNNHPQFLAGKSSILQALDKDILAMSFNAPNGTIDELLSSQNSSAILGCLSCAEEEEMRMWKEIEREKEEESRKREEEEARERAEEAAAERKREEEEARKRAEEEARKREEEEARERAEEAEKKREEEEARKRAEEEARKREEEEARERAEEAERKREEEEARKREEEKARERAEEEARKREEEEARERAEEEARKREEEAARERAEEAAKKREEEEAAEAAARKREEEEARERAEEEERKREEEEAWERAEEAARKRKEEEARERAEEEARKRAEEEARKREEEEARRREEEREERRREAEEARRQEEERQRGGAARSGGRKGGWRVNSGHVPKKLFNF